MRLGVRLKVLGFLFSTNVRGNNQRYVIYFGRGFDSRWCQWNFFFLHNPCGRTMALRLTQPLTEMSIRNISWGKGGRCVDLTTYHLHVPLVLKCGNLNLLEPSEPVQACNGIAVPLPYAVYSTLLPVWCKMSSCYSNYHPQNFTL